jgi:hypothetical protein
MGGETWTKANGMRRCLSKWHIRRKAGDVLTRHLEMKFRGFKPTYQQDLNCGPWLQLNGRLPVQNPVPVSALVSDTIGLQYKIPQSRYYSVYRPNPTSVYNHFEYTLRSQWGLFCGPTCYTDRAYIFMNNLCGEVVHCNSTVQMFHCCFTPRAYT